MKNFRKVLALVLVVATLLSFATMASADYKDQASIAADFELAVDVLTGFGIINGDETGNFRPTDEIDRDEVAKMVAVLCNGGEDIEAYYADACTFADTKATWAAGYVAYCYHTGIVDGRNATTFDPNASITGYEVAKMLLCVLGFDADEQGYVGKDWKVNVLRDARNFGLLDNLGASFNLKNNIKRQEVAQMMLNALFAPVVLGTVSDNVVKISNALYAGLGLSIKDLGIGEYAVVYGNVIIIPGETLFNVYGFGHDVVYDCFGRPYNVWAGENEVTGQKWSITRPIAASATTAAGQGKLGTDIIWFLNGEYQGTAAKDSTVADLNRAGLVVETYKTADGTVLAAFETDVAVVVDTYKYQGVNYFDAELADGTDIDGVKNTAGYQVGDFLYVTYCNGTDKVCGAKLNLEAAQAATYTAKAYFELAKYEVVKVTDVESSSKEAPADWDRTNTVFYSGKTAYAYHNANFAGLYTFANGWDSAAYMQDESVGKTYAVYRKDGYVIAWQPIAEAEPTVPVIEYAYFEGDDWYRLADEKEVAGVTTYTYYINDMIDFSAKEHDEVKVDDEYVTINAAASRGDKGVLAAYTVVNGETIITDLAPYAGVSAIDLKKGEIGVQNFHIVDSTKVLVKVAGKYEAFTGFKALNAKYGNLLGSSEYNVQWFADEYNKVTYLFIEADYVVEDGYFYVVKWNKTRTSDQLPGGELTWIEEYSVVVNGKDAKLWIDSDHYEVDETGEEKELIGGLYNVKVRYLGIDIDGEAIYYVAEEDQLIEETAYFFDHIDSNKLFWFDGSVHTFLLADDYTITVFDYAEQKDASLKYVGVKEYATSDAFNAEFDDNAGYEVYFYVDFDAEGYVTDLFIVRVAEY